MSCYYSNPGSQWGELILVMRPLGFNDHLDDSLDLTDTGKLELRTVPQSLAKRKKNTDKI